MTTNDLEALRFADPEGDTSRGWAAAEAAALKFPDRYLQLARELNESKRQLGDAWKELDRLNGFVVRNLITIADTCKAALAAQPVSEGETGKPSSLEGTTITSAQSTALYILEELGVTRVELLGRTYEDVAVDGEKVEDPFEVIESEQKGKMSEVQVKEVLLDLWVRRRNGSVQVVRRGRVNC